ncbi:MAG: right-handed parallel beta-helix repeat-containing protein [bacterium]
MKRSMAVLAGFAALACFATSVSAAIWYVKPDGTGDVPTIQAGIDAAADGDTVLLAPGTYTGPGNRGIMISYKNVSVISEAGAESTIIDCEGAGWGVSLTWDVTNATVLSDLTIENGYTTGYGGAIYCGYGASPRIERNVIRNCSAEAGGGIWGSQSSNPVVLNNLITGCSALRGGGVYFSRCWSNLWFAFNTVTGNWATQSGGAMFLRNAWPRISNNTICGNDAPSGAGIYLMEADSHPVIENTIIAFNTQGEGVGCDPEAFPLFACCDIYGNAGGDAFCGEDGGDNFSADPQFCESTGNGGYWLWSTSPCAVDNSPCGMFVGAWPVGCDATGIKSTAVPRREMELMPNYPNPFNPNTTIAYVVPAGVARVEIFDVRGATVAVLRNGYHEPGEYRVTWDGRDRDGTPVAGGVYFCRLTAAGQSQSRKVILVK